MFVSVLLSLLVVTAPVSSIAGTVRPSHISSINFFYWGDWGHNVPKSLTANAVNPQDYEQATIAKQINTFSGILHPKFIVALGDNFYFTGVNSTTDPLWDLYYRSLYTARGTYVPWYPIFGNHDYDDRDPQVQIDYYRENRDSRWTFPDFQYTKIWQMQNGKTLQIIFIDTPRICPEERAQEIGWPYNPGNNTLGAFPNPTTDPIARSTITYTWQPALNQARLMIEQSTADFLIVAGHYNVISTSPSYILGPKCLKKRLAPILEANKVDVYMNGHQHNFVHAIYNNVSYITCGHAADLDTPLNNNSIASEMDLGTKFLFAKTVGGFCSMDVSVNTGLTTSFIDETGNYIYKADIKSNRANLIRS